MIGAGTIGLASALVAQRHGVAEVVVCDLDSARVAAADRAGLATVEGARWRASST